MWLLLIVLLPPPSGMSGKTVISIFDSYEACQPERNRIGFEMAESYPNETDFRIVCEYREKKPSHQPPPPQTDQQASLTKERL